MTPTLRRLATRRAARGAARLARGALLVALAGCGAGPPQPAPTPPPTPATPSALLPEGASGFAPRPAQRFARAVVVAAHPLAAQAGERILREGGGAIDAAIAVQMVLTLVEPQSSGIGGGAFLLHWDGRALEAWDGRETAPAAAGPRHFLRDDGQPLGFEQAAVGGRAVGVPGVVPMLQAVHRAHGRLPWAQLFAPAIALAESGFVVSPRLATLLAADAALRGEPDARACFHTADGRPLAAGDTLRNPALAAVLRVLAAQGADALRHGPLADDLVRRVRGHATRPGVLDADDLRAYRPVRREPLCMRWPAGASAAARGAAASGAWRVCGMPPPSAGQVVAMQLLALTESDPDAGAAWPSAATLHRDAEAGRLAIADRDLYLADPAFARPPGGDGAALLAPAYLRQRAALIGERRRDLMPAGRPDDTLPAAAPQPQSPEAGTTHVSIVDADGRAVALTSSIEGAFGSRVLADGGTGLRCGYLLNHQLTDFAFRPAGVDGRPVANRVQPGKRPRSSMAPTMVFDDSDGRLIGVLGSPGGPLIPFHMAHTLQALRAGLSPEAALARPHHASLGGPVLLEAGRHPEATVEALRARGHPVQQVPLTSGIHLLWRAPGGGWWAAADPRREGVGAGW